MPWVCKTHDPKGSSLVRIQPASPSYMRTQAQLEQDYLQLNEGGRKFNKMQFRPGLTIGGLDDCLHGFEFFCFRAPDMTAEMDGFLDLTKGRRRLLDVGALHGAFTLPFLLGDGKRTATCVEPSPTAFSKLLYNLHANRLTSRAETLELALGADQCLMSAYCDWEHLVSYPTGGKHPVPVRVIPGDSLTLMPDVIKIDVEGYEVKVLNGLSETIRVLRPLVFLELHPELIARNGGGLSGVVSLFQAVGYTCQLNDETRREIPVSQLLETTGITRVVLSPV